MDIPRGVLFYADTMDKTAEVAFFALNHQWKNHTMLRTRVLSVFFIAASGLLSHIPNGIAESLKVPVGQQGAPQVLTTPQHGQTAGLVETQFGAPITERSVGKPVISVWEYADFWVYFEEGVVLRSVLRHRPSTKKETVTQVSVTAAQAANP